MLQNIEKRVERGRKEDIWGYLGLSGLSGAIWGYLGLSGAIWGYLGLSGLLRGGGRVSQKEITARRKEIE